MYIIGNSRSEIHLFKKGAGMMGYGMFHNTVQDIESAIYARSFFIKEQQTQDCFCFVNVEICFITIAIKRGVLKKLEEHPDIHLNDHNLIITAQHTHSATGGYSEYALYNITIPGFIPEILEAIIEGITQSIVLAFQSKQNASLKYNVGEFDTDKEVAFNRSIKAYNQNPEVTKRSNHEKHLAVDRTMKLFRIDNSNDQPIGMINWFGVHCTSISNDNHKISSDNKGYASAFFENELTKLNPKNSFTGIFAQEASADISPCYIWDKKKKWSRGKFEDDFKSAKYNGKLQMDKALEIFINAKNKSTINGKIDQAVMYVDFSNVIPDKEFTNGLENAQTGPSCHGVAFFAGTDEGPGMSLFLKNISILCTKIVKSYEMIKCIFTNSDHKKLITEKHRIHGKKDILMETSEGKILGTSNIKNFFIPSWVDLNIKYFKKYHRNGSLTGKPWIPQILPIQLIIIGPIAIAGIPGEITTVAGKRLRSTIMRVLSKIGITEVILSPFANAYCGYITTKEEYQVQAYEGGHTVYGEWTLAAFQTKFKELAEQLIKEPDQRNYPTIKPPVFNKDELEKRAFRDLDL